MQRIPPEFRRIFRRRIGISSSDESDAIPTDSFNQTETEEGNEKRNGNGSGMEGPSSSSPAVSISQIILSSVLTLLLGESSSSSGGSDLYYSTSPGLLTLIFRLFLLSWLTTLWNPENTAAHPYLPKPVQHYTFEKINERHDIDSSAIFKALNQRPPQKPGFFGRKSSSPDAKNIVIVLDLVAHENIQAFSQQVEELRDSVTFLLQFSQQHQRHCAAFKNRRKNPEEPLPCIEIVFLLESPGGTVQDYALASNQLRRLRASPSLSVTVCVDKIAASGGYMIASQSHQILAAPFAVLGSIGVLGQIMNFHDILVHKLGVRPIEVKSARYKSPVSMFGNVTDADVEVWKDNVFMIHESFKNLVYEARSFPLAAAANATSGEIAEGNIYLAPQALTLGLIDRVLTSDEYIWEKLQMENTVVLKMTKYERFKRGWFYNPDAPLWMHGGGALVSALVVRLRGGINHFRVFWKNGLLRTFLNDGVLDRVQCKSSYNF